MSSNPITTQDSRSKRVLALVNNQASTDTRVVRAAEAVANAGYDMTVFGHWHPDMHDKEIISGVQYRRFAVRGAHKLKRQEWMASHRDNAHAVIAGTTTVKSTNGTSNARPVTKLLEWYAASKAKIRRIYKILSGRVARVLLTSGGQEIYLHYRAYSRPGIALKPDIVHAHDLYTLLAGYKIKRKTGARLIYDSHELEVGRNGNYSHWEKFIRASTERFLIKRCDGVITVSDSIGDFLVNRYGIARPTIVHNAPQVSKHHYDSDDVRRRLGLADTTPLAIYVGSVTINRGIEQAIEALMHAENFHLALIGPRREAVMGAVDKLIRKHQLHDRVHFIDPVPHDRVTSFVGSADLSLVLIQDVCLSYRYCFPNKLLESIFSGVPVVVSRLVELEKIIHQTGCGMVTNQADPKMIADSMQQMFNSRTQYEPTDALKAEITEQYGLDAQIRKLLALYEQLA